MELAFEIGNQAAQLWRGFTRPGVSQHNLPALLHRQRLSDPEIDVYVCILIVGRRDVHLNSQFVYSGSAWDESARVNCEWNHLTENQINHIAPRRIRQKCGQEWV